MTEVLTISPQSDAVFGSSPLRRSTSQTSFLHQSSFPKSTPNVRSAVYSQLGYDTRFPASVPSSAPSSPRLQQPDFSNQPSYTSTPSSSLSLDTSCDLEDDDDIQFPSYDNTLSHDGTKDRVTPFNSEPCRLEDFVANTPHDTPSPLPILHASVASQQAGDDTAIKVEPSRHVDYLSHNWQEEDIWSSWRHIVAKRNVYSNSSRLENASWRTWAKSKNRLKTISPDTLNWMKDHDVTWLYGPLQPGNRMAMDSEFTPPASHLSRTNSFATKKPILKKRSLSELMLRRSISSSTLMKQAIDSLRAQQPSHNMGVRRKLGPRAYSDFASSPMSPSDVLVSTPSILASSSSSGVQTPGGEKRHIHFNDKVQQCIAINKEADEHEYDYNAVHDDDSSDDGIIMMKPVHGKERKLSNRSTPSGSFSNESKTIAMLPSTTLKYRGDTPEPPEERPKQKGGFWNVAAKLVTSPSQETLKPSRSSSNFLLDDEDDEEADMSWQPPIAPAGRRDSMYGYHSRTGGHFMDDDDIEGRGLRRTPSGMFMPYEEDEDDVVAAGLFGKVVDTVNTAKDIAHVIWNVGWRR